ncbi:hypothetical protein PRVXH_001918 [Proteinivorax hydrogeniformans]|uniref:Na+-driven multidrug efflux pump n=1 Tax=Proteinivorax hydrogeniformans TaxID=1826727 RepID=A0AAU8HS53_9FIRM
MISLWEQFSFFIPLGLTQMLISTTHTLFNTALAKLPSSEIYISAFAVAKSVMQIFQSPVNMTKQTVAALVHDEQSYRMVRRFIKILLLVVFCTFTLVVHSGGARLLLEYVMGIEQEIMEPTIDILKVFIFVPIFVAFREFMQGVAIKFKLTPVITLSTFIRVAMVYLLVVVIEYLPATINGGVLVGAMFAFVILCEGATIYTVIRLKIGEVTKKIANAPLTSARKQAELNFPMILSFFLPLFTTAIFRTVSKPTINAGLARTDNPQVAISSYAVAWGLGVIFVSVLQMFHQVPLNFLNGDNYRQRIKDIGKFAIIMAAILTSIMVLLCYTPLGYTVLVEVMGVSHEVAINAVDVLKIMVVLPTLVACRQFLWGIFMYAKQTKYVTYGKSLNIIGLITTVTILTFISPSNPGIVGGTAMVVGEMCENGFLLLTSVKYKKVIRIKRSASHSLRS